MNEFNPNMDVNPNAIEIANLEAQLNNIDLSKIDPKDNLRTNENQINETPVVENKTQQDVTNEVVETTEENNIDPIKAELEKEKGRTQGKTPQEKMAFKLKLEAQRAREMGVDVSEVLGIKTQVEEDTYEEDKPLTKRDIEELLSKANKPVQKTATELAYERIQNETERELFLLKLDRIKPSGDAEADFNEVKDMVDAIKIKNNMQIASLRPEVKTHSSANSFQPNISKNQTQRKLSNDEEYLVKDAKARGIDLSDILK